MMPRRVLMTTDAVGGVWTYALDLAGGLASRGVETVLVTLGPPPDAGQRDAAAAVARVVETTLPLDWLATAPEMVEVAADTVARIAADAGVDIVHLNSPSLATAPFAMPVLGVCHSCMATWWEVVRGGTLPADFAWRTELQARGLAAADALIAPTTAFAAATARAYQLPYAPHTVHNGRRPPLSTAETTADLVFTAGRLWDAGKDVATLDRAAAWLDAPFLAAGPVFGPDGTGVCFDRLQALGPLPPEMVARWLAQRPVFASAALYEPFGLAVLEAAQAECALVLADIPSSRELWDGAAAFVPVGDDRAFATTIGGLLRDPPRRAALGIAAQRRAERYTVAAMTEGVLGIYRDVLERTAIAGRGSPA